MHAVHVHLALQDLDARQIILRVREMVILLITMDALLVDILNAIFMEQTNIRSVFYTGEIAAQASCLARDLVDVITLIMFSASQNPKNWWPKLKKNKAVEHCLFTLTN